MPYNIREQMWNQFRTKCTWHPQHQNAINSIFEKKAAQRIKDTMFAARNASKMPDWLRKDVWDKLLEKWNTAEWKRIVNKQRQTVPPVKVARCTQEEKERG
ncbi:uncharacterized protein [Nicotiana tomentosiformis]|uniref:uncharacterized protein n=1 Tax=Nicotiana tomentosiformis TaxID=4098 RepID=UPI000877F1AD